MANNNTDLNRTHDHDHTGDKEQYDDFEMSTELYNEIELDNDIIDALDEQVLSQTLSQLSTSHRTPQTGVQQTNKIPNYLSRKDQCFQKLLNEIISKMTSTTSRTATTDSSFGSSHEAEVLQQIALLMHKLLSEQLFQSVWMAYFKSGTGQLKINQTGPSVWPLKVKETVKQAIDAGTEENVACLKLVQDRLGEFHDKMQNHQIELDHLKNRLPGDREAIHQTIDRYLQLKLATLRRKIEHTIALVQYDYNDQALELEFLQLNPNEYRIKVYKDLYDARYKRDVTREEVQLIKARILRYNTYTGQDPPVSHPAFIDTLNDRDFQEQIRTQLTNAAEQAKADMSNLYLKTAETQLNHYQQQYNKQCDKIFRGRKSLPDDQQLTSVMFNLLEQRADNQEERIKCVTQFKISSLYPNTNPEE